MRTPILRRVVVIALVPLFGVVAMAGTSWAVAPRITKITPTSGIIGTTVTVTGTGFVGVKFVKLAGISAPHRVWSSVKITLTVPITGRTGKVSVTTLGGTAVSASTFTVLPSISSFTPSSGVIGSTVTINGGGFTGATAVTFAGVASAFTLNSPNKITATVPAGAVTGAIAVTTPAGTATTGSPYTVLPNIISFAPTSGAVGTSVVITGTGFTGVTGVTFNGAAAAFVVNTSTQITATVPLTTTGPITVATTSGTATSATNFTVLPSVTLGTSHGPPTTTLVVNGSGFSPRDAVDIYFDGVDMALAGTDSAGSFAGIQITVPASALPGTHYVSVVERGTGLFAQTTFDVNTDWAMFRNSPSHRGLNPYENVLGTSTAGNLFQLWSVNTNGVPTSPAIVNRTMYVGSSNFDLYSLNADTGAQNWAFATTAAINSSPAVHGGIVFVTSSDGKLWAVNATTGLATWGSPVTLSGTTNASPTVSGGIVYVGTATGNLYAIDELTGAVDWTAAPGAGSASGTSPAAANGTVVFTTAGGRALAYNATAGGGLLWNVSVGGGLTTPLIANGSVYFGSTNQNVYALSLATGGTQWSSNPAGVGFASAPSYANGRVYFGCNDGNVYAFDTTGGNPWFNGNGTAYQSPTAVAGGVVYAGSNDNSIYALDASNGNLLWSGATNGQIKASPVIVNGTLYVASNDGHVYAYGLSPSMSLHVPRPTLRSLRPHLRLRQQRP